MNRLSTKKRVAVVRALLEGCSIRATVRMTGVAKNTVSKLLVDLGAACLRYQNEALVDLPCKRIQVDELWGFCGSKERNVRPENRGKLGHGDVWVWTAICADTKLVPCWLIGRRETSYAVDFLTDLVGRLKDRIQLTADALKSYLVAVPEAFGQGVDFAQIVKVYGKDPKSPETRYSPAVCTGCKRRPIIGDPDPAHVSTSLIERQNLTVRMQMRRFTRLTNAHSKKLKNLECAMGLHYMFYNFGRKHRTIGTSPAVEAGVADHVWTVEEIVRLLDAN